MQVIFQINTFIKKCWFSLPFNKSCNDVRLTVIFVFCFFLIIYWTIVTNGIEISWTKSLQWFQQIRVRISPDRLQHLTCAESVPSPESSAPGWQRAGAPCAHPAAGRMGWTPQAGGRWQLAAVTSPSRVKAEAPVPPESPGLLSRPRLRLTTSWGWEADKCKWPPPTT